MVELDVLEELDQVGVNFGEGGEESSVFADTLQTPDGLGFESRVGFEGLQHEGQVEGRRVVPNNPDKSRHDQAVLGFPDERTDVPDEDTFYCFQVLNVL